MYAPGDNKDEMAEAIKEFNDFVIKDERVEVVALPFRDGVNIVQRRYCLEALWCHQATDCMQLNLLSFGRCTSKFCSLVENS